MTHVDRYEYEAWRNSQHLPKPMTSSVLKRDTVKGEPPVPSEGRTVLARPHVHDFEEDVLDLFTCSCGAVAIYYFDEHGAEREHIFVPEARLQEYEAALQAIRDATAIEDVRDILEDFDAALAHLQGTATGNEEEQG